MFALDHKRELSGQWGWMLLSGIVDLVLAAMIFAGLPGTAAWALGLLRRHQHDLRRLGADRHGAARAQRMIVRYLPPSLSASRLS